MKYKSIKGFTGWAQLGILLIFLGIGLVLAAIVQIYLGSRALGPSTLPLEQKGKAIIEALMKPENMVYSQMAQILGTFFLLFIPSFAYIRICHKKIYWAGFNKHFNFLQILIAFFIIICTTFFATPFADLSKAALSHFPHLDMLAKNAEKLYNSMVAAMSGLHTWPQFFTGVFIIAFLPALFEELFFRGTLQNLFVRWWKKPVLAIIITSVLFSLVHSSYYLFISRFILGYALGLLFYKSKNIWINIFAHFMNNLMALIQLFYLNQKGKVDVNDMDIKMPLWSLGITGLILVGLFILFEKVSQKKREEIESEETIVMQNEDPFADFA